MENTTLNEWLQEAGIDAGELTDNEKQEQLRDYYQARVDSLEDKKDKLDRRIQELIS